MKFKQALLGLILGGMLIVSTALVMAQPGGGRGGNQPLDFRNLQNRSTLDDVDSGSMTLNDLDVDGFSCDRPAKSNGQRIG